MKKRRNRKDTLDIYSTEFREMFFYQASLFFYDALRWGSTSCRSKKSGWCPAKIRQNLFNIYAETLASRFALLLEKEGMMSKFHKSQSKVIDRRPNWRKKYKKKNDKTLTNKHFILKIVSRLTTLCLNNTWYFGWGTPSFTIFDSYFICWLHWEKKYIIPARSLVEISESAYRVYRS